MSKQDNHPPNTEKAEATWLMAAVGILSQWNLSEPRWPFYCCDSRFWWLVNLGYTPRSVEMCIGVISRHLTALQSKSQQEMLMWLCYFTESILSGVSIFWPSSQPGFASVPAVANCLLDIFSISRVILYFYSHSLLYPGRVSRQNRTVALPGSTMAGPPPLCRKWKLYVQTENHAPWLLE